MKHPLVLLPGLGADAELYGHQIRHLRDIADPVFVDLSPYDSRAAMAQAALDQAPPRFALAGMSMGGWVAQEVVHRAPERVTKLALLNTWARPQDAALCAARQRAIRLIEEGRFEEVLSEHLPNVLHPDRLADEPLTTSILAMQRRVGPEVFLRQMRAMAALERTDNRPPLCGVACSTLVIHGRQDAIFSLEEHERLAAAIPNAKLAIIEDCGHGSPMERPQAVTALLRYWLSYA